MFQQRRVLVAAAGLLTALAAWAAVGASGGGDADAERAAAQPAAATAAHSSTPSPTAAVTKPTSDGPSPVPAASASVAARGGSASRPGTATEILPSPSANPDSYVLPDLPRSKAAGPLVGSTLPRPASATGRLVAGFPKGLAPPTGSAVRSTSVAVSGDVMHAALVATATGDPDRFLLHYRQVLLRHGFAESRVRTPAAADTVAFRDGKDAVTVTVADGECHVVAVLRPHGATG